MGYSCGVNSQKKIAILPIDWIHPQCYQKHGAGIGVSRHYSNQFDSNDPQQLALALFIYHLADLLEPLHHSRLAFFYDLPKKSIFDIQ